LVCFHFFCTSLSLLLCRILGVFKPKRIRWTKILPLSLSFCGFVVFTNISLQHNTIGTFQVLKCLADPMFIIIQTVFYKKTYSTKVKLTMLPMILGIVVNSMYDLRFSSTGTFYALLAVVITSVYTVVRKFLLDFIVWNFSGINKASR
jgi:solute carrier family 35 protein E3